jgi:hypothetical protein
MKSTLPLGVRVFLIIALSIGAFVIAIFSYVWIISHLLEHSISAAFSMFDQKRMFVSTAYFSLVAVLFPIGSAIVWKIIGIKRNDKRLAILGIVCACWILSIVLRYQMIKIQEVSVAESTLKAFDAIRSDIGNFSFDPSKYLLKKLFWLYALGGIIVGSVIAWFVMRNRKDEKVVVEAVHLDQTTA